MIDVIIPSWVFDEESWELLKGCIQNLRTTTERHELTLTVSHSGPRPEGLDVDRLIVMNPPQGWAAACNAAFLATEAEWIVVGSTDIRVDVGWLGRLRKHATDERTIVSPIDVKKGRRREWDATERGSFWGGFYLFHRSALEEVGLLDGYRFRHMADMDWGIRAQMAGYRTVRALDVEAQHISPHHATVVREGDPMNALVRKDFIASHGATHLGAWERMPERGAA